MTAPIVVALPGSERTFGPDELPLEIGGPGAELPVPGATGPLAWIGLDGDEPFVQPEAGGPAVLCNGAAVGASRWLRDRDVIRVGGTRIDVERSGDRVRLRVEHAGSDVPTAPPTVAASPARGPAAAPATPIAPAPFQPRPIGAASDAPRALPPWLLGLAGLLVPAGALAFVLFSSQSVVLRVDPEPDRVSLEGPWPRLRLGERVLLRPGEYLLRAEKEAFRPLELRFTVEDRTGQAFRFQLAPQPGRLRIDAGGARGLRVIVDGEPRGETPADPIELEAGPHEVRLESPRYRPFAARVEIAGAGAEQTLTAELEPQWAEIRFDSVPPGATVRVDGEAVGVTPVTAEVVAGARSVQWVLQGFKPVARRIAVTAGEAQQIPAVRLAPSDGNLVLSSQPSGATVTVDGTWRGETPLDLFLAPGGDHAVVVSLAGHASQTLKVSMAAGQSRELSVVLEARIGRLEVAASPPDAELVVDGVSRGRASQVLELPARPHAVEIRRAGFDTWTGTVDIRPDFSQSLKVTLRSEEERRAAERPPRIHSDEGFDLVLVEGLRFQMGASRREPGRRANEALRDVELTRAFYITTTEVSNRQFRRFRSEHQSGRFGSLSLETDHHPAVQVTWQDAAAYCNWLSQKESLPPAYVERGGRFEPAQPMTNGYRLPTEAEWSRVARYPSGVALKYPWGEALPIAPRSGNYADASARGVVQGALADYDDGYPGTAPVDAFPPNALGLLNLGGNVAEWVHDVYGTAPAGGVERDPMGAAGGELHVIRGSSFLHSGITELRLSFRDYGNGARPDVGFRIARYADAP